MELSCKPLDPVVLAARDFWIFPFSEPMYSLYGVSLLELGLCNLQLNNYPGYPQKHDSSEKPVPIQAASLGSHRPCAVCAQLSAFSVTVSPLVIVSLPASVATALGSDWMRRRTC